MIYQVPLLPTMATNTAVKASATGVFTPRFTIINEGSNDMKVGFAPNDTAITRIRSSGAVAGELNAVRIIPGGTSYTFGDQFKSEVHGENYIMSRIWIEGTTGDVCRIDCQARISGSTTE